MSFKPLLERIRSKSEDIYAQYDCEETLDDGQEEPQYPHKNERDTNGKEYNSCKI